MKRITSLVEKPHRETPSPPYLAQLIIVASAYFLTARIGLSLALTAEQVSVTWPPTGLALAITIMFGYRLWPGIALGAFLANATAGGPLTVALGISLGNTLEALAGAWLLYRLTGFEASLSRVKDVLAFILFGVLLCTMISATVGVTSLCLGGVHPWSSFRSIWFLWWWGDGMGALITAPLLLTWASRSFSQWSRREVSEIGGLLFLLFCIGLLLFYPDWVVAKRFPASVFVFPLTILVSLRLGPPGVALSTFFLCTLATIHTLHKVDPTTVEAVEESLLSIQVFMGTVAITGLVLSATNAERLSSEAALRKSEERMRDTLEAAHVGTWEWDLTSGELYRSDNMDAIQQLPRGSFGGTFEDFLQGIHPDDQERVIQAIICTVREGHLLHEEYRQLRHEGNTIWLECKGRAFYGHNNRPVRLAGICIDTSHRKNLELRLKELTDDLEQKVKERTEIAEKRSAQLQVLATELTHVENRERHRLAHILHDGLQQLLVGATFSVSQVRKCAGDRDRTLRMAQQLDAILDEAIQASRSLSQELFPPGLHDRTFSSALAWLAREMKDRHGLQVDLNLQGEPAWLTEDLRIFLFQSVRELLFNVVKHAKVDHAAVNMVCGGNELRIEIIDFGAGFDIKTLERSQLTGLGLISIRERIDQMGGRLEIESALNKGSRFVISIHCGRETLEAGSDSLVQAAQGCGLMPTFQISH